jgi:hypothetical protein
MSQHSARKKPGKGSRKALIKQLEINMNKKLKSSALMLAAVLMLSAPAFAHGRGGTPPPGGNTPPGAAPEVDPSLAIAGISFLAGSLAVLRSRLRK